MKRIIKANQGNNNNSGKRRVLSNRELKRRKSIMASATDGYTEDLSDFGFREIRLLRDILDAWVESGLPDDFEDSGVKPAFNTYSGNVFLVNDEYQTCMEVDGKLESWYYTPYSGHEGFYEDLMDEVDDSWDREDIEYLKDIAEYRSDDEGVEKLEALLVEEG